MTRSRCLISETRCWWVSKGMLCWTFLMRSYVSGHTKRYWRPCNLRSRCSNLPLFWIETCYTSSTGKCNNRCSGGTIKWLRDSLSCCHITCSYKKRPESPLVSIWPTKLLLLTKPIVCLWPFIAWSIPCSPRFCRLDIDPPIFVDCSTAFENPFYCATSAFYLPYQVQAQIVNTKLASSKKADRLLGCLIQIRRRMESPTEDQQVWSTCQEKSRRSAYFWRTSS